MFERQRASRDALIEFFIEFLLFFCACLSILTTLVIAGVLLFETFQFFREAPLLQFFTDSEWTPLFAIRKYGIFPLVMGTFLVTGIALALAIPTGVLIALYLAEYASSSTRRWVKPALEMLAGIPTVVYGYFALLYVTPFLQAFIPGLKSFNALSPGVVLSIMVLPLIISLSEDAMRSVPVSIREAAFALGSSRLQTSLRVVVPAASSGIIAACVLAFSRAVGETMIVTIAAGQSPRLSFDPLEPIQTMTAYIIQLGLGDVPAGSLEYRTIFVVGTVLFVMTLILNGISHCLKRRFQEIYR